MKRFIIITILSFISILSYGQKVYNDGVITKFSKTDDGYEVQIGVYNYYNRQDTKYFRASVSVDINEQGIVSYIKYYSDSFVDSSYRVSDKTRLITYLEFDLGLRNLAGGNITTAVYRSKYYEYRVGPEGFIVELIKK